ncbi:heterocycloanthracin/sonorensin family bacteriocin [Paenibacillus sp. P26]|nr:heterocycloanthracin/sonorensin family bacteriocin [Paenibacillus sp. P26]
MDDFKKDLQNLSVSDFNAGEMVPAQYQGQPFAPDARLCVFTCFGIGFGFGRFGFGGCFGRGGCGGCFRAAVASVAADVSTVAEDVSARPPLYLTRALRLPERNLCPCRTAGLPRGPSQKKGKKDKR